MNKPALEQKDIPLKRRTSCLLQREAAPRIELIETARPLFQCFEFTGHALQVRILGSTRYPLLSLSPVSRPKIGETAAGEREPLNSLFEVAPEARPKRASDRSGDEGILSYGCRWSKGSDDDGVLSSFWCGSCSGSGWL
jgi:hypothetical protein